MNRLPVKIPPTLRVTDEQFLQFVTANPDLRLERTAEGELIVMAPTGSEGGSHNGYNCAIALVIDCGSLNFESILNRSTD